MGSWFWSGCTLKVDERNQGLLIIFSRWLQQTCCKDSRFLLTPYTWAQNDPFWLWWLVWQMGGSNNYIDSCLQWTNIGKQYYDMALSILDTLVSFSKQLRLLSYSFKICEITNYLSISSTFSSPRVPCLLSEIFFHDWCQTPANQGGKFVPNNR